VVAFIDTNPSLSIWTQMALTAGNKLIVPVNADDFSTAAITNMFFSVYALYTYGGNMQNYENTMFAYVAKQQGISMPKIHAVVHNRSAIHAKEQQGAFAAMSKDQSEELFKAFLAAKEKGVLDTVFNLEGGEPTDLDEFRAQYTGVMRDMLGSGVATTHGGIPMYLVRRHRENIQSALHKKVTEITASAKSSFEDFVGPKPPVNPSVVVDLDEEGDEEDDEGQTKYQEWKDSTGGLLRLITGTPLPADGLTETWVDFEKTRKRAWPKLGSAKKPKGKAKKRKVRE